MKSVTTDGEVKPDRTLTVRMPDDFPLGPARVTVTTDQAAKAPRIRTFGDLLSSEFFGMFAERDDLPRTNDEFREWRGKLSERHCE
jgi:hypothetical protein